MPDIFASLLAQTTPSTYGIFVLVVMGAVYFWREWRDDRKLSSSDRLAKREGYAAQVELLMGENRKLLADMETLRIEYDDHRKLCYAETEQLRQMIIALQNEIEGLKRRAGNDALEILRLQQGHLTTYEQVLKRREGDKA